MLLRQKKDLSYKNLYLPNKNVLVGGNRTKSGLKNNNFFFSIITVVLNNANHIEETINSVINQKVNLEYIIIDGGSVDGTLDIIKKYEKYLDLWISENDNGIYDAMNKGIKLSKGSVIGILNADDIYYSNTLKIANKYFSNYNIDFLFGSVFKDRLLHGFWPKKIWYKFNIYPAHSCGFFVKKNVHKKIGLYDTTFKYSSDRDFIYKILKKNLKGMCADKYEVFGKFNPYGISSKVSFLRTVFEEFYIRIKNGQSTLTLILVFFLIFINKFYNFFLRTKSKY